MRASTNVGFPAFQRSLQCIAGGAGDRKRGSFCVMRRPSFLAQRRPYSTRDPRVGRAAQPSPQPAPRPTRSLKGRDTIRSLNSLSQRVFQHLAAHPLLPDRDGLWAIDELLHLLLLPYAKAESASRATVASPTAASRLHPLLCVRVLQRLRFAVCDCNNNGLVTKGWTSRHIYPSLTSGGSAADTSALQRSTSPSSPAQALAGVAAMVLGPLLPLLGDGTPQHLSHSQVTPVAPIVAEWLCTLPTSEAALPMQQWLPWVVAQYSTAGPHGGEGISEVNRWRQGSALAGEATSAPPVSLPPLVQLLPHLIRKLSRQLSEQTDISAAPGDSEASMASMCEKQLSTLFRLCSNSPLADALRTLDPAEVSVPTCPTTLSDVLWWSGDEPLVHLPGVRRALAHLASKDVEASAGTCHLQTSVAEEEDAGVARGGAGGRGDGRPAKASCATAEANSCLSFARVLTNEFQAIAPTGALPQLSLRLADDDMYRRFLLRLTALQHTLLEAQHRRRHSEAPNTRHDAFVLLSLELSDSLSMGDESGSHGDPDIILRFIQPLYEYVLLIQEGFPGLRTASPVAAVTPGDDGVPAAAAPVLLTFTSVVRVLSATFHRLEALKQQSSCRYASATNTALRNEQAHDTPPSSARTATPAYTLLPQKARLHTLKCLCEALLHHARGTVASRAAVKEACAQAAANETGTTPPSVPASMCAQPWFIDVDVRQQEAVLRRFCGAARALVRVVMEERRSSLLEEGPEGSVLTASTLTASHRNRPAGMTTAGSCEKERPAAGAVIAGTAATAVAPVALAARQRPTASSVASFDHTLRTLAFRVVEPALWSLYDACTQCRVFLPLHVLTFEAWLSYLNVALGEEAGDRCRRTRNSITLYPREYGVPLELPSYVTVMEAARALYESVGGQSGLQTAQQVLPRPGQQSVSALVEGIRLTALQCCVFDGLRIHVDAPLPEQVDCTDAYMRWVLDHTGAAFFSVWQRLSQSPNTVHGGAAAAATEREAQEMVEEGQRRLRHRLGLLTLVLHVHVLLSQQRLRLVVAAGADDAAATLGSATDSFTAFPSLLTSILHRLITDSTAATSSSSLSDGPHFDSGDAGQDEWSLVLRKEGTLQACRRPPPGTPSGCSSLWELVEELGLCADTVDVDGPSFVKESGVTWRWLGSPEALWDVSEETAGASTAPFTELRSRFILLPWTTVARSHQLLRVYDESGQSQRAAYEWEATLQSWLAGGGSDAAHAKNHTETPRGTGEGDTQPSASRSVVRLVSIAEELRFFASLQYQPMMDLAPGVRVVCEEVRREVEAVAPAVIRQLSSSKRRQERQADAERVEAEKGWYTEDHYDGLD
ncbi:hypothetical protein ABL78_0906 [Leptomonas seymouri]|uniref:Uncharacterized protein n=1 Tax=Leptomonas seymouri TaxID=5684 RepID=A0A0N1I1C8_LEPSE|nr:hypothetical protein ABL78_0906 [Leptomonas seymouri]|eukprot:KPI89938.1 hypothetical protein ABL78_0906 [Leptomonas seymouri]